MHQITKIILVFISALGLIACSSHVIKPDSNENSEVEKLKFAGDMLNFSEIIGDQPESGVRMIITDDFLRMDDGPKSPDFVLYDRNKKIIYNVLAEEKSIMVIENNSDTQVQKLKPPFSLLWNVESQTSHALMRSDDKNSASATHYRLKLNQKECYNLVAVDQGMDKPLAALREFRQALADQLKKQYKPQKGQECYEAVNIFSPLNHLHQGFPIREWSVYGYQRFLIGHRKKIIFPKRLFELPEGYSSMKL